MRRFLSIFFVNVFTLWLVPLGIFIAPSKEKLLCDGQRAICLCSHAPLMSKKSDNGKTVIKASPAAQKESSPSAAYYHLASHARDLQDNRSSFYSSRHKTSYNLLVCKPVEHVPKA